MNIKKAGRVEGISQSLSGRIPKRKRFYRVVIIVRVRVVLRGIVFGTNFQRFEGLIKEYCPSNTLIQTIRPQGHTSVRVNDTVTEGMSSNTLEVFK